MSVMNGDNSDWVKPSKTYASTRYNNKTDHMIREWFYNELDRRGIESVLDVGCGKGQDASPIIGRGVKYFGVDPNPVNIEYAKEFNPDTDFRVGYAQNLKIFPDNSVDCVWMMGVWESLPKNTMKQAIMECIRVAEKYVINVDAGYPPLQLRERWSYIPVDWNPTLTRIRDAELNSYYTIWDVHHQQPQLPLSNYNS